MHKLKLLTAAIALLVVTPVVAQEMGGGPIGPGSRYGLQPNYDSGYYDGYGYYHRYPDNGFWPGELAGDVVGGAIGTAGAIATAPFRALDGNNAYAMGSSTCAQRYRSYDPASGTFMGLDGRRHPCR
jgi:hypothetical protein